MSAEVWVYTTRCEACEEMTDYVVWKKSASNEHGYTHEGFRAYVETMTPHRWLDCEKCGRMTLQTVVAYEHPDELEDPTKSKPDFPIEPTAQPTPVWSGGGKGDSEKFWEWVFLVLVLLGVLFLIIIFSANRP